MTSLPQSDCGLLLALRRQKAPEVAALLNDRRTQSRRRGRSRDQRRTHHGRDAEARRADHQAQSANASLPIASSTRTTSIGKPRECARRSPSTPPARMCRRAAGAGASRCSAIGPSRRGGTTSRGSRNRAGTAEGRRTPIALTSVIGKVFAGPEAVRKASDDGRHEARHQAKSARISSRWSAMPKAGRRHTHRCTAAHSKRSRIPKLDERGPRPLMPMTRSVRTAGRAVLIKKDPAGPMQGESANVLAGSNVVEQQGAFAILAANPSADADALIEGMARQADRRRRRRRNWLWRSSKRPRRASRNGSSAAWRVTKNRGRRTNSASIREDARRRQCRARPSEIFLNKAAVQCQRCHQLDGQGGEVGPPVNGAGKQTREYLLEAIVLPSKAIAKGYDTVLITTLDDKTVSGVLKGEDDKEVRLMTAEGKLVVVKKSEHRRSPDDQIGDAGRSRRQAQQTRTTRPNRVPERLKEEWKK